MKPTDEQLRDPNWWDGEGLPPVGCKCEYDPSVNSWTPAKCIAIGHDRHEPHAVIQTTNRLYLVDDVARLRPLRTKEQRERDQVVNAEPQPEHEPIADRIMELGNQVHNLCCEVQNNEGLAGELEDIRGWLWDLGGEVRKVREREELKQLFMDYRWADTEVAVDKLLNWLKERTNDH